MKTMGILGGMACESTVTYYQVINDCVNRALGDHHSARCILYSVDFQDIIETHRSGDWDRAAEVLSGAGLALKNAGVDFLVLATNTMHIVAPQIQAATGLPLLHIADVTADRLLENGVHTVGLLGTKFTMEKDFYKEILIKRGITPLVPEQEARNEVHRIIDEELAFGNLKESSRAYYQEEIRKLKERGAEGVILGCTEIGLLIQQEHSVLPVFDTAQIHAEESVKYALKED
ncbi:MAG: aspartate/glutamate racemase family protein [Lachnospiraceae bacterium]|nr:aspartate/glutamate racemase family protein [Lachnospiraceae bacterium]